MYTNGDDSNQSKTKISEDTDIEVSDKEIVRLLNDRTGQEWKIDNGRFACDIADGEWTAESTAGYYKERFPFLSITSKTPVQLYVDKDNQAQLRNWAKNEIANEIASEKAAEAQKALEESSSLFFEPTRTAIIEKIQDDLNSNTDLEKMFRTALFKCHPDKVNGKGKLASNKLTRELTELKTYYEKVKEPDFFYTEYEANEIFKPFPPELRNKMIARLKKDYPAKFPYEPPKEQAENIHDEETSRRIVQNLTEKTGHQWVFDNQGFRCDAIYQGDDWKKVAGKLYAAYPFIDLDMSTLNTLSASCNSAKDQSELLRWSNTVDQARREEQRRAEEEADRKLLGFPKNVQEAILSKLKKEYPAQFQSATPKPPEPVKVETKQTDIFIKAFKDSFANIENKKDQEWYKKPENQPKEGPTGTVKLKFASNNDLSKYTKQMALDQKPPIPFTLTDNKTNKVMAYSNGDGKLYHGDGREYKPGDVITPCGKLKSEFVRPPITPVEPKVTAGTEREDVELEGDKRKPALDAHHAQVGGGEPEPAKHDAPELSADERNLLIAQQAAENLRLKTGLDGWQAVAGNGMMMVKLITVLPTPEQLHGIDFKLKPLNMWGPGANGIAFTHPLELKKMARNEFTDTPITIGELDKACDNLSLVGLNVEKKPTEQSQSSQYLVVKGGPVGHDNNPWGTSKEAFVRELERNGIHVALQDVRIVNDKINHTFSFVTTISCPTAIREAAKLEIDPELSAQKFKAIEPPPSTKKAIASIEAPRKEEEEKDENQGNMQMNRS